MENKVLATVNGSPIYESEVDEFLEGLGQRGAAYNNPQGREIILEQIINSRLFLIDAQKNLLEADPAFTAQLRKLKMQLLTNFAVEKHLSTVKVTDEEVEAFYNEHPEAFMQGETVNASHILVATEEEALSVYAKIAGGEMTFEDAAKEYSSCP
ncbi:MAG: peptidyl-prolyl cis-trans isomerase, partial [Clostridia bacterium]|nr:peptidyl-prolyl cis-trans isomerase [Clostridia bacterium]